MSQTRTPGADRLRRSCHFVPGANEKMLNKSIESNADCLILDLEDAVTPDRKDSAREVVAHWLGDADFRGKERTVRMNPLDTPWGLKDLEVTMRHAPDAYVVPKVSTLDELNIISAELDKLEAHYGHPAQSVGLILVSTETPLSALNVGTFSQCSRVVAISWGAEDLSAALGAPRNRKPNGDVSVAAHPAAPALGVSSKCSAGDRCGVACRDRASGGPRSAEKARAAACSAGLLPSSGVAASAAAASVDGTTAGCSVYSAMAFHGQNDVAQHDGGAA